MTSLLYKFVTGKRSMDHLVALYEWKCVFYSSDWELLITYRANLTCPKIPLRRSTHSRWHGRICGLVIETNQNVYGPFAAGTCGYEVWEVSVNKILLDYMNENALYNDEGDFIGFITEPDKGTHLTSEIPLLSILLHFKFFSLERNTWYWLLFRFMRWWIMLQVRQWLLLQRRYQFPKFRLS